jgi:hypothetical protein
MVYYSLSLGGDNVLKNKYLILMVLIVLALVSVASAALPSQVTAMITYPGPVSYWDVDVTSGGGDIPTANDYVGMCGSSKNYISVGSHVFNVYSSLKPLPSGLPYANWNKINYVINHKAGADKYTLQAVIWYYDSGPYSWGTVDPVKKAELIAEADKNPNYVPGSGENYAVILWSSATAQPIIIELPVPDIPVPEFPTLAVPVAMLVGVVGMVHYVRTRKE